MCTLTLPATRMYVLVSPSAQPMCQDKPLSGTRQVSTIVQTVGHCTVVINSRRHKMAHNA